MIELNDEVLCALLDGQLDEPTRAAVEQALASDPGARVRLERMRQMDSLLRAAIPSPLTRTDDPLVARIQEQDGPHASAATSTWWRSRVAAAVAAGAGGLLLGNWWGSDAASWIDVSGAARGGLLQALQQQPSGAQGAAVRIILSTQVRDGRYCREFVLTQERMSGEGLACRSGTEARWQLIAWDGTSAAGVGFQPAGGGAVLESILDGLGAGAPLDASSERALIAGGWRGTPQ